ncbi:MAG: SRPBCC family protein [Nannocystaceae bacterium]|nr:SRPBCC family protein [bacterium]
MKKVLLGLVGLFVAVIVGVLVMASMQPDISHVERSAVIEASPEAIMPHLTDMKRWVEWSPWAERDPNVKWTFSDPAEGKGAWYEWEGNEDVGKGRMEVTAVEDDAVSYDLQFIEPFESEATVTLRVGEQDAGTQVTWEMDSENAFMSKVFMVFMDFDAMLGADFEQGLGNLAKKVES